MSAPEPQAEAAPLSAGRRWTCRVLFALALLLLAWAVASRFPPVPTKAKGDDHYYLRYLQAVSTDGVSAFPGLFERWNASPVDRIFPPPSRVGYVLTSVAWGKIVGADYRSLQTLSVAAFLLLCLVNYVFARRHFGEERACLLAALAGFSPLLMGLSRLAFSDSYAALCMTSVVWIFLEVVKDPESRAKRVLFVAMVFWTALVKELSVLLLVPFLAFLLYERLARREPHRIGRFLLDVGIAGAAVVAVLLLAAGGFEPLWTTIRTVLASPSTNRYAQRFGSGPWFRPILDFLLLSPWPILLATGWLGVTASRLRSGRYERESVYFGFVCATTILVLSFFTKNVRYVAALEMPIRAFAVLFVCDLVRGPDASRGARRAGIVAAVAVAFLCWLDWRNYELFWVRHPGADPITQFLAGVRQLLP